MIKLSSLKPEKRNPRKITDQALAKLAESIKRDPEFMTLRPIIYDADGVILGGNQRYRAIKEILKEREIPDAWVVKAADLTPEQRRRFQIIDNAPEGMAGDWDMDILAEDWDIPELVDLGFDLVDIDEISFSTPKKDLNSGTGVQSQEPIFNPSFAPQSSVGVVTSQAIDREENKLINKFNAPIAYIDITCPHCGADFSLKKDEIING